MINKFIKKLFAIVYIIIGLFSPLNANSANDAALTVMSFNIQGNAIGHDYASSNTSNLIAEIINISKADIVLLQEVCLDSEFVFPTLLKNRLDKITKGKWDYKTSFHYGECNKNQHNMVMYNTSAVTFIRDIGAEDLFKKNNKKYNFSGNKTQVLKFQYHFKDFIIANVHLAYNNNKKDDNDNLGNRRSDLQEIGKIYAKFKRSFPIIVGGDFNFKRKDLKSSAFADATIDGDKGFFVDLQGKRTTLTKDTDALITKNDYDHFVISNKLKIIEQMSTFLLDSMRGKILLKKYNIDSSLKFGTNLSDHLPIKIEVLL